MARAVHLREDYSAVELRRLAKRSKNSNQSQRLLALAAVREGEDRTEAAKIGGTGCPISRTPHDDDEIGVGDSGVIEASRVRVGEIG
jgi:hypothetical protein